MSTDDQNGDDRSENPESSECHAILQRIQNENEFPSAYLTEKENDGSKQKYHSLTDQEENNNNITQNSKQHKILDVFNEILYCFRIKTYIFVCLAYAFIAALTESGMRYIPEFIRKQFIVLGAGSPCKSDIYPEILSNSTTQYAKEDELIYSIVENNHCQNLKESLQNFTSESSNFNFYANDNNNNYNNNSTTTLYRNSNFNSVNTQNLNLISNTFNLTNLFQQYQSSDYINCDECKAGFITTAFGACVVVGGTIGNLLGKYIFEKPKLYKKLKSGTYFGAIGMALTTVFMYICFTYPEKLTEYSVWILMIVVFLGVSCSFPVIIDMNNRVIAPDKRSLSNSIKLFLGKIGAAGAPGLSGYLRM